MVSPHILWVTEQTVEIKEQTTTQQNKTRYKHVELFSDQTQMPKYLCKDITNEKQAKMSSLESRNCTTIGLQICTAVKAQGP